MAALAAALAASAPGQAQTVLDRVDALTPPPVPSVATASGFAAPADQAQQQALLERTIRNPSDLEATYAYIEVSRRLRDNEAAIGALERLVDYNPRLARANYELALLYFQLGSFDATARYLQAAAASPTLDPAIAARVAALEADTVKQQQQSRWSGFFQTGLRYQSNATFIPNGGVARLNAQDFLVGPAERRRADGSVFGLAQIGNDYDLQNQRGDVLETRLTAFGSAQFRVSDFNFGYVEASFGPRFGWPELMPGASIKPYVVGQTSLLRLERAPYVSSAGGGVSVRLPVLPSLTLDSGVEVRALGVNDRNDLDTSTFNSGTAFSAYLLSTARLTDAAVLETRFVGIKADAGWRGQSFNKGGASLALSIDFDPPSELIPRKWRLTSFLGGAVLDFERPNPAVDLRVTRRDRELSTGLVLDAPLTGALGISATLQYDRIDSNLPNYRQHGLTVLGGPTARF